MYLGSRSIDGTVVFPANTHNASTGAAATASSPPTYKVYEDETAVRIMSGSMALLNPTGTIGFYSELLTCTVANGFEKGKSYTVYITGSVGGVAGTMSHSLQINAEVDAELIGGAAQAARDIGADTEAIREDTSATIPGRLDTISGTLTVILADTNEMQADDIPGRLDTLSGSVTVIDAAVNDIQGTGFATATSSLAAIRTRGDVAWTTGAGGSAPTVEEIRTEMDDNSTKLASIVEDTSATIPGRLDTLSGTLTVILADTNELQSDDIPSRLDTLSGSVSAIPTTAMRGTDGVSLVIPDAAGVVPGRLDTLSASLTVIAADTNELQTDDIPGRIDTLSASLTVILADTNELQNDDIPGRLDTLSGSVTVIDTKVSDIQGTGFASATSSLAAIRTRGDVAWTTGAGGSSPTVEEIRTEMDDNSTKLASISDDTSATIPDRLDTLSGTLTVILADTNELQTDDIPGRLDTISSSLTVIAADTNELQTDDIPGRLDTLSGSVSAISTVTPDAAGVVPGRLDTLSSSVTVIDTAVAAIQIDTSATIPAQISGLNDVSTAEVNAEVLDVLYTDTHAEPGTGKPGSTISFGKKIDWIFKSWRNKMNQTATVTKLFNDDESTVGSQRTTAGSSSTATVGEWVSG